MLALNRSAIVVRPKLPFLDWLHAADPTSATLTLADLGREPTIYLVPECGDAEEERAAALQTAQRSLRTSSMAGGGIGRRGRRPVLWNFQSLVRLPVSLDVARPDGRASHRGTRLRRLGRRATECRPSFWTLRRADSWDARLEFSNALQNRFA